MVLTQVETCHQRRRRCSMRVSSRLRGSSGSFSRFGLFATLHALCTLYATTSFGVNGLTNAPLVVKVAEEQHFCFFFDIPYDDDAHFIFTIISDQEPKENEQHAMKEMMKMVDSGFDGTKEPVFPRNTKHRGEARVSIEVNSPGGDIVADQKMKFFVPLAIRHVLTKERLEQEQLDDDDLHGEYEICIDNSSRKAAKLLAHLQLQSDDEDARQEKLANHRPKIHKKHLTPLEQSIELSVERADRIIREMNFMAERERRMHRTSESTNMWVRRFSWLSIIVLLSVTLLQVVYLKSYFKKKKLM